MARFEEYFQRMIDLRFELLRGNYAVLILESIEAIQEKDYELNGSDPRFTLMSYFSDLIKKDLAMIVWRAFFDSSGDANTIKSLNTLLRNNGYPTSIKIKLSNQARFLEPQLYSWRTQAFAHLQADRELSRLSVKPLIDVLYQIIDYYNLFCDSRIDDRVKPITEIDKTIQMPSVYIGIKAILDDFRIEENEGNNYAGH